MVDRELCGRARKAVLVRDRPIGDAGPKWLREGRLQTPQQKSQ